MHPTHRRSRTRLSYRLNQRPGLSPPPLTHPSSGTCSARIVAPLGCTDHTGVARPSGAAKHPSLRPFRLVRLVRLVRLLSCQGCVELGERSVFVGVIKPAYLDESGG